MQSDKNEERVLSKLMQVVLSTETTGNILVNNLRFSPFLRLIWTTRKCYALSVTNQNHPPAYKHHGLLEDT
jgi:hypothetical protein